MQRAVKVITKGLFYDFLTSISRNTKYIINTNSFPSSAELIWKVWFEAAQVEERSCWRICEKRRRKLEQKRTLRMKEGGEEEEGEGEGWEEGEDGDWGEEEEEGEEEEKGSQRRVFEDCLKLTRQVYFYF